LFITTCIEKQYTQSLSLYVYLCYVIQNDSLILVGLSLKFDEAHDIITAQLSQSDEKSEMIEIDEIKREYIRKFASEIGLSEFLQDVDMEKKEKGLRLLGKQRHLKEGAVYCKKNIFQTN